MTITILIIKNNKEYLCPITSQLYIHVYPPLPALLIGVIYIAPFRCHIPLTICPLSRPTILVIYSGCISLLHNYVKW